MEGTVEQTVADTEFLVHTRPGELVRGWESDGEAG